MSKKSNKYWQDRAHKRMAKYHTDSDKTIFQITNAYDKAMKDIQDDIDTIFGNFMRNGGLGVEEAKRLLNQPLPNKVLDGIRARLHEITDPDIKNRLLAEINSKAYMARITRLEALKESINLNIKKVADIETKKSSKLYAETINSAYYRNLFDIQKGLELGFNVSALSVDRVQEILRNPWSGEHFSKRIWGNTDVVAKEVEKIITSGMMSGKSKRKMAKELEDYSGIAKNACERLIRTETTYMANQGELESYRELDIEEYMFVATLDSRTSATCQQHDHKIYKVSEAKPGTNMPPLHPYCRSTTRAYFSILEPLKRRARSETGETYLVDSRMTYGEWKDKFVEQPKRDLQLKKLETDRKIVQNYIKENPDKLKVNKNSYEKHDPNHKRYADYVERNSAKGKQKPSYLTISYDDVQKLINKYSGTGKPIMIRKKNEWKHQEDILENNEIIGVHIDQLTGKETETSDFRIHYGKTGTHIVPTKR